MHVDFPYRVDSRGRTALTGEADYIRDLIEQVLFTAPGERVNRPDFGSGLLQLVFAPNSDLLAGAVETSVQAALQRWLGDLVLVEAVDVASDDAALAVTVRYVLRRTRQREVATFTRAT
jgi:phage baseplate assembly protein W